MMPTPNRCFWLQADTFPSEFHTRTRHQACCRDAKEVPPYGTITCSEETTFPDYQISGPTSIS